MRSSLLRFLCFEKQEGSVGAPMCSEGLYLPCREEDAANGATHVHSTRTTHLQVSGHRLGSRKSLRISEGYGPSIRICVRFDSPGQETGRAQSALGFRIVLIETLLGTQATSSLIRAWQCGQETEKTLLFVWLPTLGVPAMASRAHSLGSRTFDEARSVPSSREAQSNRESAPLGAKGSTPGSTPPRLPPRAPAAGALRTPPHVP